MQARTLSQQAVDGITRIMSDRTLTDLTGRNEELADLTRTVLEAASLAETKDKVLNLADASTMLASVSTTLSGLGKTQGAEEIGGGFLVTRG